MDRSSAATTARIGGRLVAVLLPLAAVGLVRAIPSLQGSPQAWVAPAVAGSAAVLAGLALLAAVWAFLEEGRLRDLADLAALGMLGTALAVTTLAVTTLGAAGNLGLGIGAASAGAAFLLGSLFGQRMLPARRGRVVGLVIGLIVVEACLAAIVLAGGLSVDGRLISFLLLAGAVLLAVAGVTRLDDPTRATALGIAASSAAAISIGAASGTEALIGLAGSGAASALVGWRLVVGRLQPVPVAQPMPAPSELTAAEEMEPEPEYDELSRISRELRATLDDLVAARHLIELQRVEIERASSVDQLTGLPNRWAVIDRLRTEAAEARRYHHPVAAVLFDIDAFAALNHEHGLDAGDAVLRELALRLRIRMREADAVGRIGADAFLAILPHTDEGGAATFAEAVLARLLERRVVTALGEIEVRISIGIAIMRPGMTLSGDEVLAAAEEALDSARAAGGNRIAFDRLHGLARLDGDRTDESPTEATADEANDTR